MTNCKIQLFILPFAGGTKLYFKKFEECLANEIEVITLEYPGRGIRVKEPPCKSYQELVEDCKTQIERKRNRDIPFVLMGYSMGSEIGFELAQYILEEKPIHVILCARESIELITRGHNYGLLDIDTFSERILEYGGINQKIRENTRFYKIALRQIYEDYKLLNEFVYKEEKGKLTQDLTIFYSSMDTDIARVKGWDKHTTGTVEYYEQGENHFFIEKYYERMAHIISKKLLSI